MQTRNGGGASKTAMLSFYCHDSAHVAKLVKGEKKMLAVKRKEGGRKKARLCTYCR